MTSRSDILSRQVAWAQSQGFALDEHNALVSPTDNLREPLMRSTEQAFRLAAGGELAARRSPPKGTALPAKLRALNSSSALVVNVFDYWTGKPKAALWRTLGMKWATDFTFDVLCDAKTRVAPPTIDLVIKQGAGPVVGVESKFTEWLTPRDPDEQLFNENYFPEDRERWTEAGLTRCQLLADALYRGESRPQYLQAEQLLKQILGLSLMQEGRQVNLLYLFYDVPGDAAVAHQEELVNFANALSGDVILTVLTYQKLFARLQQECAAEDADYLTWLGVRYFPEEVAS